MDINLYYKIFDLMGDKHIPKQYFLTNMKKTDYNTYIQFIENKFFVMKILLSKNNSFIQYNRNELFEIFEKSQRFIFGIYALKKHLRLKNIQNYDCNKDLNFSSLDDVKENLKVSIIENEVRYKFSLCDIVNIINNSLAFHDKFFSVPSVIKNPYTNLPFSKSSLIKIYSVFKSSSYRTPLLFERFYDCFFDIQAFEKHNEQFIREHNIKFFIKTESIIEKCEYIHNMLLFFNKTQRSAKKIIINPDFPENRLIQIFQKFLHMYLNVMSINSQVRIQNKKRLVIALKQFHIRNPIFGRKIIFKSINKLYEYSNNINIYNRISTMHSYIPTTDLIDIKKKCYFIGEYNNTVSIFTLDCEITNSFQKLLTRKDLDLLCLFIYDNNNNIPIESNYCVPEMKWNELYYNKNLSETQNIPVDDSDDSDDGGAIYETTFMYTVNNVESDNDIDETVNDEIDNYELGDIGVNDNYDESMDVVDSDDNNDMYVIGVGISGNNNEHDDQDTYDDQDAYDDIGDIDYDNIDEDYLQMIIDDAIEDGEI